MKYRKIKYGNRRFDFISKSLRFNSLLISNSKQIPKITKMGISAGSSKINDQLVEIYSYSTQRIQSKRNAYQSRYRNTNNQNTNSISQRFRISIYKYKTLWNILRKTIRNRKDFWGILKKNIGLILYRGALRGGNWNNLSKAGAFALNLNNEPSNRNNNIGFRAALILKIIFRVNIIMIIFSRIIILRISILVNSIFMGLAKNMNQMIAAGRYNRMSQSLILSG